VTPPAGIDGVSYLPTLLGKPREQGKHPYLYWEFHEQGKKQAVRLCSWKGIRLNVAKDPNAPIELYDLATDLGEERNVAAEHPEMVAKIAEIMATARTQSDDGRCERRRADANTLDEGVDWDGSGSGRRQARELSDAGGIVGDAPAPQRCGGDADSQQQGEPGPRPCAASTAPPWSGRATARGISSRR
jgi:hypothetical protein